MSTELIQWHHDRAKELNAHADQLIGAAHDARSSEYTRGEKKQRAALARGMAEKHMETVTALEVLADYQKNDRDFREVKPCLTCDGKAPFCGSAVCRPVDDKASADPFGGAT